MFNDTSTLWVILCCLSEEGREEIVEEMKERDMKERGKELKWSEETEEIKTFPLDPYLLQGQQSLPNC